MIRLQTNSEQRATIGKTLIIAESVFDFVKSWSEDHGTTDRSLVNAGTYRDVRDTFPLFPSQLVKSVRSDVCRRMKNEDARWWSLLMYRQSFKLDPKKKIVTLKLVDKVTCMYTGDLNIEAKKFRLYDQDGYVLEEVWS